jgi:hypothetical protein
VALHHAAQGVEEGLERTTALQDRERALMQRIAQRTTMVAQRRLGRTNDHRGRRCIHAAQDLEDPRAGRFAGRVIHRKAYVHDGDVDPNLADHMITLGQVARPQAPNALRLEQPGQQVGKGVIPPATVGKQKIQVRSAAIMCRTHAIARAEEARVGAMETKRRAHDESCLAKSVPNDGQIRPSAE